MKRCTVCGTQTPTEVRQCECGSSRFEPASPPGGGIPTSGWAGKRWALCFVAGTIAVAALSVWLSRVPGEEDLSEPEDVAVQAVSAEQLRADIKQDVNGAAGRYMRTRLVVTGKVQGVTLVPVPGEEWDVTLTGEDEAPTEFPWIACRVLDERVPAFKSVKIGDTLTVEGFCYRLNNVAVRLRKCKLVEHRPKN